MKRLQTILLAAALAACVFNGGCGLAGLGSTAGAIYALISMSEEEEEETPPPVVTIHHATVAANGPAGGRITALACDSTQTPDHLYAGTFRAGILKSTDDGATWALQTAGFNRDLTVTDVAIDPASPLTVFASTGRPYAGGVFVTVNGGTLWTQRNQGLLHVDVRCLAAPATGTVYAGTGGSGLFSGAVAAGGVITWTQAGSTGLNNLAITDVAIAGTNVIVATEGGVFNHDNSAAPAPAAWTWTAVNSGLATLDITVLEVQGNDLWAGTNGGGVYYADITGLPATWTWTLLTSPGDPTINDIEVDPADPLDIYVSTPSGIYISDDGGTSWGTPTTDPSDSSITRILMNPAASSTMYASGYSGGFFGSTDSADTWTVSNTGIIAGDFAALAVDPASAVSATVYLGYWARTADGSSTGAYKSTDGGGTWTNISSLSPLAGGDIRTMRVDPVTTATVYAATDGGGVYKSVTGGSTWAQANVGLGSLETYALAIDAATPNNLYAGTALGIYRSTDGAGLWTAATTQPPAGWATLTLSGVSGIFLDGEVVTSSGGATGSIYAGGGTATLLVESLTGQFQAAETLTGGTSTATATISTANLRYAFTSITVDPAAPAVVWCTVRGPRGGVYRSADSGATWALTAGQPGTEVTCFSADPVSATTYYAGTSNGAWRTVDSGANWTAITSGMGSVEIYDIIQDGRRAAQTIYYVFAATASGLFRSSDRGSKWEEVVDNAPVNPALPGLNALMKLGLDPIAGNEDVLYAATGGRGAVKLTILD